MLPSMLGLKRNTVASGHGGQVQVPEGGSSRAVVPWSRGLGVMFDGRRCIATTYRKELNLNSHIESCLERCTMDEL